MPPVRQVREDDSVVSAVEWAVSTSPRVTDVSAMLTNWTTAGTGTPVGVDDYTLPWSGTTSASGALVIPGCVEEAGAGALFCCAANSETSPPPSSAFGLPPPPPPTPLLPPRAPSHMIVVVGRCAPHPLPLSPRFKLARAFDVFWQSNETLAHGAVVYAHVRTTSAWGGIGFSSTQVGLVKDATPPTLAASPSSRRLSSNPFSVRRRSGHRPPPLHPRSPYLPPHKHTRLRPWF
jgi:hypothetical protein